MTKAISLTNLLWFLFFIASLLEFIFHIKWAPEQKSIGYFLAGTLGLNSIHVGLTAGMCSIPEYNKIHILFFNASNLKKNVTIVLSASALLLFSIWAADVISVETQIVRSTAGISVYQVLLTFHALMQTKGLCLLLFGDTPLSLNVRKEIGRLFTLLLAINGSVVFLETYYANSLPEEWLLAACIAQMPLLFSLAWNGRTICDKKKQLDYFIFCGRLILWPLSLFSFTALIGVLSLHGFEYFEIAFKMLANSKMTEQRRKITFYFTIFCLIFITLLTLGIPSWTYSSQSGFAFTQSKSLLLRCFLAALIFFTTLHILLDSLIFRFRDPLLAEKIKPLILN